MTVLVNDQAQDVHATSTLDVLLTQLGLLEQKGIAVAINNKVVARNQWSSQVLSDHDKITIIRASQGG